MPEPQPIVADVVLMRRLAQRDSTALVELQCRHRGSLYAQVYGILMDADPWTLLREMARKLARADVLQHKFFGSGRKIC